MWLIIDRALSCVQFIEGQKPPAGAYNENLFEIKEWLGDVPRMSNVDPDTGAMIPGDLDPTLADPGYTAFEQERTAFELAAGADWGGLSDAEKDNLIRRAMPYVMRKLA